VISSGAQRASLHHGDRRRRLGQPFFVAEEDVHIPRIPVERAVLVRLELVGDGAGRQHLAPIRLVVDARDVAVGVQLDAHQIVLQQLLAGPETRVVAAGSVRRRQSAPETE
jgi:hypothetical protein